MLSAMVTGPGDTVERGGPSRPEGQAGNILRATEGSPGKAVSGHRRATLPTQTV